MQTPQQLFRRHTQQGLLQQNRNKTTLHAVAERPGSPTPGRWCSIVNRDALPAFGAAGLLAHVFNLCFSRSCSLDRLKLGDETVYLRRQNRKHREGCGSLRVISVVILKLDFHGGMPRTISTVKPQRTVSPSNAVVLCAKCVPSLIVPTFRKSRQQLGKPTEIVQACIDFRSAGESAAGCENLNAEVIRVWIGDEDFQ